MAEIKSTLQLVMERLEKLDREQSPGIDSEETVKEGMRRAAAFLRGEQVDLAVELSGRHGAEEHAMRQGMARALLRNIVMPREEEQISEAAKAMEGLLAIGKGRQDLAEMFVDMQNILSRYLDHRKQIREQLEAVFAQQIEQMEQRMAQKAGVAMKLSPSQHPKFKEEWERLLRELDEQYGKAIRQYKDAVVARLG